ncbi:MAG: 23S rRNA-specific endonuclease VapC20 [Anaerolineales bacterium]|nr:23S rRNA-specific endonuclease VapC20 [Anaerolineales bacterium]
MAEQVFVDTAYVLALVNERDQYHGRAQELADFFEGQSLLITDAVLLEIGNALSRGFKKQAIDIINYFIESDEVEVIRHTSQVFDKAFAMYKKFDDKEWSLVDCISFVVMREKGVKEALTFDSHFQQAGFKALM